MTMPSALSLHSVEGFLENCEIAGIASFFAGRLNPLFLQCVLRWTIGFVEHTENAGERKRCEFVCGDFVGDVVPQFILWCAVPFLFLNYFEASALLRIGRVEHVREKFYAFAQA